jgi:7-cyano-7-deazaguanine reductase
MASRRGPAGTRRQARRYGSFATAGLDAKLPRIETWDNQFPRTTITVVDPEYNAICPKTGLPDFGTLTVQYEPDRKVVELKSFKLYMTAFRNVGIFYENAVNRVLRDLVRACEPVWMTVTGEFAARGGIRTRVEVRYDRGK